MSDFIIKYFSFLKHVPLLPQLFDAFIRLQTFLFNKKVLEHMEVIEQTVLSWEKTSAGMHLYGGLQFNVNNREIGHIHSNGLVDVMLKTGIKEQLLKEGRVEDHHIFKRSGWVSLHVKSEQDKQLALELLEYSYLLKR
jgi:hypothetical protein